MTENYGFIYKGTPISSVYNNGYLNLFHTNDYNRFLNLIRELNKESSNISGQFTAIDEMCNYINSNVLESFLIMLEYKKENTPPLVNIHLVNGKETITENALFKIVMCIRPYAKFLLQINKFVRDHKDEYSSLYNLLPGQLLHSNLMNYILYLYANGYTIKREYRIKIFTSLNDFVENIKEEFQCIINKEQNADVEDLTIKLYLMKCFNLKLSIPITTDTFKFIFENTKIKDIITNEKLAELSVIINSFYSSEVRDKYTVKELEIGNYILHMHIRKWGCVPSEDRLDIFLIKDGEIIESLSDTVSGFNFRLSHSKYANGNKMIGDLNGIIDFFDKHII